MKKTALITLFAALSVTAQDYKTLYNSGEYARAVEVLTPKVKKSPRDASLNLYMGLSLIGTGDTSGAVPYLKTASSRGSLEGARVLAETAMDMYDTDTAQDALDQWEETAAKAKKKLDATRTDALQQRLTLMKNMMERVENIVVLDSLDVDSANFFSHYRLSESAGNLVAGDMVARSIPGLTVSMAYVPESRTEMLWGALAEDSDATTLYSASILDNGEMDTPQVLETGLGGESNFPYVLSDGTTMYFASTGNGSLGGYDIFMTRRNDDGTLMAPQNVGMPYNSPANDYMLVLDEGSGLGWWATDRNSAPGRVTIYTFALPHGARVNHPSDSENLAALARLSSWRMTVPGDVDAASMLNSMLPQERMAMTDAAGGDNTFAIDINGRIYTSLRDFRNDQARSAMLEYLGTVVTLRRDDAATEALRDKYRHGDKGVAPEILRAERQRLETLGRLRQLRSQAIRLENQNK